MREIVGDIWEYHSKGNWVVITTNGIVKKNGCAVMGKGIAFQAANRFSRLPSELGERISFSGNKPYTFSEYKIFTLPTKYNWREQSVLELIESSITKLLIIINNLRHCFPEFVKKIYMVRPGCSNGGLDWKDVKPILEKYLDDRFIIVEKRKSYV